MANIELESGLTINYLDLNPNGDQVLLLLHGLGATGESWQLQFPPLVESGFRVLAPDMRGFGRSTYPGGSNNSGLMAQDMIKFLDQLEIDISHIIGISMGGTIALQLILKQPSLVESLVLTNTFAKLRPRKISPWFFYVVRLALLHIIVMKKQADYVAKRLFQDPHQAELRDAFIAQVTQANPNGYRSTLRSFARYDLSAQVREIKTPTLIITGERDSVVPPAVQAELANQIPNAQHVIIPDAGHAVIVEQPEAYNRVILDFLPTS
jgi:3-oxoadipate enol-lactonase